MLNGPYTISLYSSENKIEISTFIIFKNEKVLVITNKMHNKVLSDFLLWVYVEHVIFH